MNKKLIPIGDRLIVKPVEVKEVTKGGLFIPTSAKDKPMEGVVIAVGNGKLLDDGTRSTMDIKVDDTVIYGKYSGTEVKIDDAEYLVIHQDDILCVVSKES